MPWKKITALLQSFSTIFKKSVKKKQTTLDSSYVQNMFKTTRPINKLIIHCAATSPKMDVGAEEIRKWHVKGNGWKDIGYHHVIRRNGQIEDGRPVSLIGAHCSGQNTGSIGVCLVGGVDDRNRPESNFTPEQWRTLERYVRAFKAEYPKATIHGHNEFDSGKACPSFDVLEWLKENGL